jgi:hypothetical protein
MTVSCTSDGGERRYWILLEIEAGTNGREKSLRASFVV